MPYCPLGTFNSRAQRESPSGDCTATERLHSWWWEKGQGGEKELVTCGGGRRPTGREKLGHGTKNRETHGLSQRNPRETWKLCLLTFNPVHPLGQSGAHHLGPQSPGAWHGAQAGPGAILGRSRWGGGGHASLRCCRAHGGRGWEAWGAGRTGNERRERKGKEAHCA